MGELGLALYGCFSIRPARKASRPASTAFLIAEAINAGFSAAAMAVAALFGVHPLMTEAVSSITGLADVDQRAH